jgi:hypothetical protein
MRATSGTIKIFFASVLVTASLAFLGIGTAQALTFLDDESMECLKCHESSADPSVPLKVCHGGLCDHPIGVDYAELSSANPGLVKPSGLNRAVRLIDGMIGCTTCHIPYNQYNHKTLAEKRKEPLTPDPMLSVDNTASGLCSSCHLK